MFSNNRSIEITFNYFYIVFIIIDILMNSYTDTSSSLLQVICSIHLLFIFDLYVSYLLDQCTLILKIILGCDSKSSVVRIQTVHTELLPPQACGRSWQGFQFFYCTCHNKYIYWLQEGSSGY